MEMEMERERERERREMRVSLVSDQKRNTSG
jgi:hypothetical protein